VDLTQQLTHFYSTYVRPNHKQDTGRATHDDGLMQAPDEFHVGRVSGLQKPQDESWEWNSKLEVESGRPGAMVLMG